MKRAVRNTIALIPCYNVEKYCRDVIEKTLPFVTFLILVNDGSIDGTGAILRELSHAHQNKIGLIEFPSNQGKGMALMAGMDYALKNCEFDVLVTLDSDGQHNPSEIKKLADLISGGYEFAIGCRDFSKMPFRSRFANTIISFLLRCIYSKSPKDNQSGFRAFSRKFVQKIKQKVLGAHYEMEFQCILLAVKDGDAIGHCPIQTIYLDQNRSSHFKKITDSFRILKVFWRFCRKGSL